MCVTATKMQSSNKFFFSHHFRRNSAKMLGEGRLLLQNVLILPKTQVSEIQSQWGLRVGLYWNGCQIHF